MFEPEAAFAPASVASGALSFFIAGRSAAQYFIRAMDEASHAAPETAGGCCFCIYACRTP
jgi:hypothetical protein